jgi:ribose transport system substrate-binding protein
MPDRDAKLASGAISVESGGHYADPYFAFLLVYNAIRGNYPTSTDSFYEVIFPYMFVASSDDYTSYAKYFTGTELPYYPDEIKAMADYSFEDLQASYASLSVADVVARHTK